jgi:hypothetical protein
MLFEVALIKKPSKKAIEEGTGREELILAPTAVIANDAQAAAVQAVITNKDKVPSDMNLIEVLVRPFVSSK